MSPRRLRTALGSLTVATSLLIVLALAGPAAAEPSVGWPDSPSPDPTHVLLVLGGIPLLLALVLAGMIYLPPLIRGERIAPNAPAVSDQWLGGPRKAAGELAAPDSEESKAGGARGTW